MATASLVVGAFIGLVVSKSGNGFAAFAAFALIALSGAVASAVRETVELLLGGSPRSPRRRRPPRAAVDRDAARRERPRPSFVNGPPGPSVLATGAERPPRSYGVDRNAGDSSAEGSIAA